MEIMEDLENTVYQIPTSGAVMDAQQVMLDANPVTPETPVTIAKAFPTVTESIQNRAIFDELSAISDEVIACRNSILSNIY